MNTRSIIWMLISFFVLAPLLAAEEQPEELIINPTVGGYGAIQVGPGTILKRDPNFIGPMPQRGSTHYDSLAGTDKQEDWPAGALVMGRVPNIGKKWAVAVTKDEAEFQQAFPEFKRLIAEGNIREAKQVLHICTRIDVASSVEEFLGNEKTRDVPEDVGRFWFMLSTNEYLQFGGYLTFLSFTPDPENPMIGIGGDIGEKIHGTLKITTAEGNKWYKHQFAMEVIKARIVEPTE